MESRTKLLGHPVHQMLVDAPSSLKIATQRNRPWRAR